VFNMLNRRPEEGKNAPMVCKFLVRVCAFPHNIALLVPGACYLLEQMRLTSRSYNAGWPSNCLSKVTAGLMEFVVERIDCDHGYRF
jgi:hypothetical protein